MKQMKFKSLIFKKKLLTSLVKIKLTNRKNLWYEPIFRDTQLGYLSSLLTHNFDETVVKGRYNIPMLKSILRDYVSNLEFDNTKPRLSHEKLASAILWFINSVSRGITAYCGNIIPRNEKVYITGSFAFLMWYVVLVLNRKQYNVLFGYGTQEFFDQMKTQILLGRPGDLDLVVDGENDLSSTLVGVTLSQNMDIKADYYKLLKLFSESEKKYFISHKKLMFCLTDKTLDFKFFKRKIESL